MPRILRMFLALVMAAVLAGLTIMFLGLVDAGRELEATLSRLDGEAAALHRATSDTVERGAPAEAMTRPRASLKRMIDALPADADRIVRTAAPPYTAGIARAIADAIDLRPTPTVVDGINRAYADYLEQTKQAGPAATRTPAGMELTKRLLDLSHGMLAQRISDARDRTRQASARALNGLQLITFISIAIAALALGLRGDG